MRSLSLLLTAFVLISACKSEKQPDFSEDISAVENGLLPALLEDGDSTTRYSLMDRMEHFNVPGVSIAVVRNGKLEWARAYGTANTESGQAVDTATLFQAGSISKPVAALAALQLWEQGKVDLDTDVTAYLQSWKLPDTVYSDSAKVTLRMLLTHTGGTTVHGFPGYAQSEEFPSDIEVLDGLGNTDPIRVDTIPGTRWRYSGGGYTIMERVVEDVNGETFEAYMARHILPQLGMVHSTYQQPLQAPYTANASAAYDGDGELYEGYWHNYPEQAAAGLWTTPADLAAYCIAVQEILAGKRGGPVSEATVAAMLTKHQNDWGLGPALRREGDSLLFGHGGKNAGFTNNMIAAARQGFAIIVMTSADQGGALMSEVIRGASEHYKWGLDAPRRVRLIGLSEGDLQQWAGRYLLDFQVPDVGGDYWIEVSVKEGKLFVDDTNNGQQQYLSPRDTLEFLDMENGDEVYLKMQDGQAELTFNGRYRFVRVVE